MQPTRALAMMVFLHTTAASAGTFEASLGAGVLGANAGGEALTKWSVGPALDLGVGVPVRKDLELFGRLIATTAIEDEQHIHDQLLVAGMLRLHAGSPAWFDGGLALGFYRGRYRYADFFADDAEYDDEIATPTLIIGAGFVVYRGDGLDLIARANVALSPFGGEVSVSTFQALLGIAVPFGG